MPRIQFSDVTPPERRSIRDVPIPSGGKRKVPVVIKPEKKPEFDSSSAPSSKTPTDFDSKMSEVTEKKNGGPYEYYYPKDKQIPKQNNRPTGGKKKQWIFGTIIFLLVSIFIVGMMTLFASANIDITPKSQEINVDLKITGAKSKAEEGTVRYEVIKLPKTKEVSVPATGEEVVELKASGKIVIYNNFSSEPQRLIVRTRFESPEGLIYRIPESIVVPGKTAKNGVETPGSVEVEVFADEAGEKYNIKKTDFTIPGFKNDAGRYKGFYARSVTEMTGGFVGKMKKVAENEKQAALQNIQSELEVELKKDLESKVPEELTLLPGSVKYESRELPSKEEDSSVVISKEVTAYAIMLNKSDLSKQITDEYISKVADWSNIEPIIKDFSLLRIANIPENLETEEKIDLQINGGAKVWAYIDTNAINQRLLGVPKKEAVKLMDEFAGISSITATIRPIWKSSFPENPLKIHVQTIPDK